MVSFNNHNYNLSRLEEMARLVKHRGPDDEGYAIFGLNFNDYSTFYGDDTPESVISSKLHFSPKAKYRYTSENYVVGLAHRRLSIIDLTPAGHQPMCDESGRYWIAHNGEIYNFQDIRKELKQLGYSFFSDTDTEVIIKSYMEWGHGCQNRFNGMWAFAIWDNKDKELFISRDRFGVKPLYYMFHDNFFILCSEIKSILPLTELAPNYQEFYGYLLDGPSNAHKDTFFKNVYRFPAGNFSKYNVRNKKKELFFNKYWELKVPEDNVPFSEKRLKDYSEEYYFLLKDAVKVRLFADVNVSCALSGGLDSSSIVYLACKILEEGGGDRATLSTVSNVYYNKRYMKYDESEHIDIVVGAFGIKSFRSEPNDSTLYDLNSLGIWHYENCPDKMPIQILNTFNLCKINDFKVNLDGQGSDEITAGYNRYWNNYFANNSFLSSDYIISLMRSQLDLKMKLRAIVGKHVPAHPGTIFEKKFGIHVNREYRDSRICNNYHAVSVNQALQNSVNFNLKNLLRDLDAYSMTYSVESRQPFMDYRLILFLNSVPSCFKLRNGWTKFLARVAFDDKLPAEIVWRKDKMGWPRPLKEWLSDKIGNQVVDTIKKSILLKELIGDISNEDLGILMQTGNRSIFRLFNLARHYEIFFNNERVRYIKHE